MFIILGATGHIGAAAVAALRDAGENVLAVVHDAAKADALRRRGAEIAEVDIGDADALRAVLRRGRRALLLNPPADPSGDSDAEERRTMRSIVAALDGSGLEKVVAISTYGAQPGAHLADLGVLYEFEQALAAQPIPVAINRGAYYMSNWDGLIDAARGGTLPTMLPADLIVPMVAPEDLGRAAVRRLRSPIDDIGIRHIEGPARYTPQDVADAFAAALGRPVALDRTPPEQWREAFRALGFSDAAADSYARMTEVTVGEPELPDDPDRDTITLQTYIADLVARS